MQKGARLEINLIGYLKGHTDWVTAIVTNQDQANKGEGDLVISGSRDKGIIIWKLFPKADGDQLIGQPRKLLKGHSHFISDLALSNHGTVLLSSSWDNEVRSWDLTNDQCKRFKGNEKELFTVALSPDNKFIFTAGAERKIKLYNILGELKHTQKDHFHSDWISQLRYSPIFRTLNPYLVSVGWDGWLKVWNTNQTIRYQFKAHEGQIHAVAINPIGEYIATGGKDKKLYLWNITDLKQPAFEYDAGGVINALAFHPQSHFIAAATENGIRIWQIVAEDKQEHRKPIETLANKEEITVKSKGGDTTKVTTYPCTSLAFDATGSRLYGGFSDGKILVWELKQTN